ncbi:Uncharacterised protein [Chlamydia abortus]|nr:Uncharacterised protein [Chlamydia abortus]
MSSQKAVPKELPALFCAHALKEPFPADPTQQFFKQPFGSPEAQGPGSAFCQACIPPDHKPHQGMLTAAQAVSNLNLFNALLW